MKLTNEQKTVIIELKAGEAVKTLKLYEKIDKIFPRSSSCEWDNDGIMVLPSNEHETKKALLCLDVTSYTIDEAIKTGANCIISHHPFIFKGMKSLSSTDTFGSNAIRLIKNDIAVLSFHTRMDASEGGINSYLAALFGLTDITVFECDGEKIGRRGRLKEPVRFEEFLSEVTKKLNAQGVAYVKGGDTVQNVVLVGGSYDEGIAAAEAVGADVFLSGELKYHNMLSAKENGFSVIAAGHYFTESAAAIECFCEILKNTDIELVRSASTSPISYTEA